MDQNTDPTGKWTTLYILLAILGIIVSSLALLALCGNFLKDML